MLEAIKSIDDVKLRQLRPRPDGNILLDPAGSRTRLMLDGAPVGEPRVITLDQLQHGVIVELSNRVALLLHWFVPRAERDTGDLGLVGHSDHIGRVRDDIQRVAISTSPC